MTPRRFKTLQRINTPGHARELTFSTANRTPLLATPAIAELFLNQFRVAADRHAFALTAFVVMPDHVHLLGTSGNADHANAAPVSAFLASVKRSTSYRVKQWLTATDPDRADAMMHNERSGKRVFRFWQPGGGYDRNLTEPDSVQASIDYIHHNPVRAGLTDTAQAYEWSSARQWADAGCRLPEWMPKITRGTFH